MYVCIWYVVIIHSCYNLKIVTHRCTVAQPTSSQVSSSIAFILSLFLSSSDHIRISTYIRFIKDFKLLLALLAPARHWTEFT